MEGVGQAPSSVANGTGVDVCTTVFTGAAVTLDVGVATEVVDGSTTGTGDMVSIRAAVGLTVVALAVALAVGRLMAE